MTPLGHTGDAFTQGLDLLTPFFEEHDFVLRTFPPVDSEDGTLFSAQYVWGSRAVTLTAGQHLLTVTYSIGQWCLDHTAYLEALGVREDAALPAYTAEAVTGETTGATDAAALAGDALAGCRALLSDLESRLMPFFEEPDREFIELAMAHGRRGRPWTGA